MSKERKSKMRAVRSLGISETPIDIPRSTIGAVQKQREREERERIEREAAELKAKQMQEMAEAEATRVAKEKEIMDARARAATERAAAVRRELGPGWARGVHVDENGNWSGPLRTGIPASAALSSLSTGMNRFSAALLSPNNNARIHLSESAREESASFGIARGIAPQRSQTDGSAHTQALLAAVEREFNNLERVNTGLTITVTRPEITVPLSAPRAESFVQEHVEIPYTTICGVRSGSSLSEDIARRLHVRLAQRAAEGVTVSNYRLPSRLSVYNNPMNMTYNVSVIPAFNHVIASGYGSPQQVLRAAIDNLTGDTRGPAIRLISDRTAGEAIQDAFTLSIGSHEHWIVYIAGPMPRVFVINEEVTAVLHVLPVGGMELGFEATLGRIVLYLKDYHSS